MFDGSVPADAQALAAEIGGDVVTDMFTDLDLYLVP